MSEHDRSLSQQRSSPSATQGIRGRGRPSRSRSRVITRSQSRQYGYRVPSTSPAISRGRVLSRESGPPLNLSSLKAALTELKNDLKTEIRAETDARFETMSQILNQLTQDRGISQEQPSAHSSPLSVRTLPFTARQHYETPGLPSQSVVDRKISRILCDKFTGSQSKVSVTQWLTIFETVTFEYSEREKLLALTRHLSDEALSWYAMEISPRLATITWLECRSLMQKRFDQYVTNRIIEASDRRLHAKETVLAYYNDMRRLMAETGAAAAIQVAMLTKGMPESYRPLIASHKPKTPEDWIEIALVVEESKGKRYNKPSLTEATLLTQRFDRKSQSKKPYKEKREFKSMDFSKPPSKPCRYCLDKGEQNFHWMRFCPKNRSTRGTAHQTKENPKVPAPASPQPLTNTLTSEPMIQSITEPNFVYFDVDVNGQTFKAFLDSGSTITVMSSAGAEKLGLKPDSRKALIIKQVDGTTRSEGAIYPELGLNNKSMRFPVQILNRFDFDMLLGIDFANAFELKVDFAKIKHSFCCLKTENAVNEDNPINDFLKQFKVFAVEDKGVGRFRDVNHVIRLKPNAIPINRRPFRLSPPREAELRKHVEELEAKGLIRRSKGEWAQPMFLIDKKCGKIETCC